MSQVVALKPRPAPEPAGPVTQTGVTLFMHIKQTMFIARIPAQRG